MSTKKNNTTIVTIDSCSKKTMKDHFPPSEPMRTLIKEDAFTSMEVCVVQEKQQDDRQTKKRPSVRIPIPTLALPERHALTNTAILDSHYTVFKKGYEEKQFDKHREWLTVVPKKRPNDGKDKCKIKKRKTNEREKEDDSRDENALKLYSETQNTFTVPRFYGLARWGMVRPTNLRTTVGKKIDVHFVGTLTEKQEKAVGDMIRHVTDPKRSGGGIFKCPCGFGKSVCAMAMIARLGRKALMTVHKEELMNNLREEAKRFLPDAKVGILHRGTVEIEGYDICIAMIQSVLSRDYPNEWFRDFGVWLPDEAHHMAAPSFSTIRNKITADKIIALSATPRRKDIPTHVLFWYLGPIVVDIKRTWELVLVTMIRYTKGNQEEVIYKNGNLGIPTMITRLAEQDRQRNYMICRDVAQAILNPDPLPRKRKCLILSDRLKQLDYIRDLLIKYFTTVYSEKGIVLMNEGIPNQTRLMLKKVGTIVTGEKAGEISTSEKAGEISTGEKAGEISTGEKEIFSIGYMTGQVDHEQRQNAKFCDVILATYPQAEEGVNVPRIDTIFLVSPRSDVEQAVGRGLRSHPEKNIPHFYYYVDAFSLFEKQGWKVRNYFEKEGYRITWRDE